ncbi:hypothetical protein SAMN05216388_101387 [Halorientalis persicus]|uniref:Helicase HerA central domain-containing protein n=1 Tax=Halorientalis persicus TaxID=1367881 RepID=A0A1H8Q794_9EURY|nr:DUF87 domain-containing protein [Halorientalis persicus]SEO50080.1 hypothetical protein SAMN05216388_101387 [Halorientalis persicus]
MIGPYTLSRPELIALGVGANALIAALMVAVTSWQYRHSKVRAGVAGMVVGISGIVIQRYAGARLITASWPAYRAGLFAGAIAAVVSACIVAALVWRTPLFVEVVLPWRSPSDDDSADTTADPQTSSSLTDRLLTPSGEDGGDDEDGRIPIDDLSGEEMQEAIEYLEAVGQEPDKDAIEKAAYQLASTDETTLATTFTTDEEKGRIDRSVLAPEVIDEEANWHSRDGDFYQILTASSLPRFLSSGWLLPLTLASEDVRLSMQINPRETEDVKSRLQKRLTQMKSAIQRKKRRNRTDTHEQEHEAEELDRLLGELVKGTTKLFDVSVFVEIRGQTLEEMQEASKRIQRRARQQGLDLTPIQAEQDAAQASVAPLASPEIENHNTVQLEALTQCFNFVEPAVDDENGILLGFDNTNRPVIINRYGLSGHSKAISGKVGSGKTYATKMALWRRILVDDDLKTIIFDPLGDDFVDFVEQLGGTVIKFGGDYRINPLDIDRAAHDATTQESAFKLKLRNVVRLFGTYLDEKDTDGMTSGDEGVISNAIYYAYLKQGITPDPETFDRESPIIDDVIEGVGIIANGGLSDEELKEIIPNRLGVTFDDDGLTVDTDADDVESEVLDAVTNLQTPPERYQTIARQLEPKLESLKQWNINSNLNGPSNIDLDDDLVVFDMSSFADTGEMPIIMHAMLNWAYDEARRSDKKTDVTFEEAHYLLRRDGARDLINLFIRHSRHFSAGLTLISQTAEEFLKNDATREIYDNCDVKQLFYQENVGPEVVDYFELSEDEVRDIQRATRGEDADYSECLLSTSQHGRRWLDVYSGEFEHHILDDDRDPWTYLQNEGMLSERDRRWMENNGYPGSVQPQSAVDDEALLDGIDPEPESPNEADVMPANLESQTQGGESDD